MYTAIVIRDSLVVDFNPLHARLAPLQHVAGEKVELVDRMVDGLQLRLEVAAPAMSRAVSREGERALEEAHEALTPTEESLDALWHSDIGHLAFGPHDWPEFEDGAHGLSPLWGVHEEARTIAELFGIDPVVGPDASETAVRHALEQSRYVHIATHGRHKVAAPAFQCLYLRPEPCEDGRLAAYEL